MCVRMMRFCVQMLLFPDLVLGILILCKLRVVVTKWWWLKSFRYYCHCLYSYQDKHNYLFLTLFLFVLPVYLTDLLHIAGISQSHALGVSGFQNTDQGQQGGQQGGQGGQTLDQQSSKRPVTSSNSLHGSDILDATTHMLRLEKSNILLLGPTGSGRSQEICISFLFIFCWKSCYILLLILFLFIQSLFKWPMSLFILDLYIFEIILLWSVFMPLNLSVCSPRQDSLGPDHSPVPGCPLCHLWLHHAHSSWLCWWGYWVRHCQAAAGCQL